MDFKKRWGDGGQMDGCTCRLAARGTLRWLRALGCARRRQLGASGPALARPDRIQQIRGVYKRCLHGVTADTTGVLCSRELRKEDELTPVCLQVGSKRD